MLRFLMGTLSGIHIAQVYNVPNLSNLFDSFLKYLKQYEQPPPRK